MKKMKFSGESRFSRFFKGRGFYVALAVCLVAVCGLAVTTFIDVFNQNRAQVEDPGSFSPPSSDNRPVDTPQTDVPDTRTTALEEPEPTAAPPDDPTAEPDDLFVLPLTNEVMGRYSTEPVFSVTLQSWRLHTGVDFKGEIGQTVKAVADGTVEQVYSELIWGDCLLIDHGYGVKSLYWGAASSLKTGHTVKVNEEIGVLSEIPCESVMGPHLHLEMQIGGETVDPVTALGREVKYLDETEE